MSIQLDLFSTTEALPEDIFHSKGFESENLDMKYQVEDCGLRKTSKGEYRIFLRLIEHEVWLWGYDVLNKKKQSGQGFYPFRKWGKEYASLSRDGALNAAMSKIEKYLGDD